MIFDLIVFPPIIFGVLALTAWLAHREDADDEPWVRPASKYDPPPSNPRRWQ